MAGSNMDTGFPADSIEFCPHPSAFNIFACGTYKLEDNVPSSAPQKRRGQCLLFQMDPGLDSGFRQVQAIDLPAVPDMKWCHRPQSATPILGIADSEGSITIHEWQETEGILKKSDEIRCATPETLCLSLDWSNRRHPGSGLGSLIVSLSNGFLCLLRPDDGHGLSMTESWQAHDYEPWVAAWNYWDTNVAYSGGDDLKMKGWDLRQGFRETIFTNKRFNAGVTSIQSHPHIEHMIAVGGYDNTVQLFDTRKPLTALTSIDVGGGAWRVKWHPSETRKYDLLVACMHDGFKIVTFKQPPDAATHLGEVIERFDLHQSLAYGVDWSFDKPEDNKTLIGSCSFYDHMLHLWSG